MGSLKQTIRKRRFSISLVNPEYTYIYRRKTIYELIRLSVAVVGIECTTSALTSYVSPILLEMGIDYNKLTLVWALSPMIGFFLSPVMGSLSDRCRLRFGRRRPFVLIFAAFNLIGLLLIPFGEILSNALQQILHRNEELESKMNKIILVPSHTAGTIAIMVTIVGVVITDYTADALQNPCRAYLLDSCRTDDHVRGLTTFTVMAGLGGCFGYLLGSVDWTDKNIFGSLFNGHVFEGHVQMFFTITAILFAVSICVSVTTFKEVPLPLIEITHRDAAKFTIGSDVEIEYEDNDIPLAITNKSVYGTMDEEVVSNENEHPSLKNYLRSILHTPYSVRVLCVCNIFCWMAHLSYALYFTDFVGIAVYGGDPEAPSGSRENTLYEDGVKFGCKGMAVYSLSCTVYSLVVEHLIRRVGLKRLYMFNILTDSVSLLLMAVLRTKVAVMFLSVSCGILYSTIFTVPYILIAHYHTNNVFEMNRFGDVILQKQNRGLGTDVALIGSCAFVAQFALSVIMAVITNFTASSTVVIVAGSISAIGALLSATKVMYLDV